MKHTHLARVFLGSVGLLLLLACNSPVGNNREASATGEFVLELVPAKGSFARDEEATLQLKNRSDENLGYGACSLLLERRSAAGWSLARPEPEVCILILYLLPSGEEVEFAIDFSSLDPGVYRYRMDLLPGTHLPETTIHSPEFVVLP